MPQNGVPQFVNFCRCTPCRQRRGKGGLENGALQDDRDAPRAGSAEAKAVIIAVLMLDVRMHPVQAAPFCADAHARRAAYLLFPVPEK